jgi:hypothetical protein
MKECTVVKNSLVAYLVGELGEIETNRVSEHIDRCPFCLDEYNKIRNVFDGFETLRNENATALEEVDWAEKTREIERLSIRATRMVEKSFFSFLSGWRILVPVLPLIFVLGLMLGYFLFHTGRSVNQDLFEPGIAGLSFSRIENTLAKKEILGFLKQTQLLLTELMNKCDYENMVFQDKKIKTEQIRALLMKSRYLSHDLDDPQLMSSRNLLTKIELLLYEISALDENVSCESIQSLQQMVQQERLFFKIRLIEKELILHEV